MPMAGCHKPRGKYIVTGALGGGGDAISAEMTRQMVKNAPLRSVQGFAHLPDAALQNMIAKFNQLLGNPE